LSIVRFGLSGYKPGSRRSSKVAAFSLVSFDTPNPAVGSQGFRAGILLRTGGGLLTVKTYCSSFLHPGLRMIVRIIWPCWSGVLSIIALAGGAEVGWARPVDAETLVEKRYEWHRQQARLEVAEEETRQLTPPRVGGAVLRHFQDPHTVLRELRLVLTDDYTALRNAINKLAEDAQRRRTSARKMWEEIYRERIQFGLYSDEQQAHYGFDWDRRTPLSFRPTIFDGLVLVWAVVLFVIAVRFARHVRRVALRRAARAAAALLLLGVVSLPGCSDSAAGRPWLIREDEKLTNQLNDITAKADAAVAQAQQKWQATLEGWVTLVAVPGTSGEPVERIFRDGEADVRTRLQEAALEARLAERLLAEAEAERTQLAADRNELADLRSRSMWRASAFAVLRSSAAVILLGLAILPYWRAQRQEAAIIRADAKKCPRCFSERLIVEKSAPPPGTPSEPERSGPRYRNPRTASGKTPTPPTAALSTSSENSSQETGYIECQACSFRFLRSYQKVRRLCFPVVGVRASGKTHMLATGYDRVRKRTAPTIAVVQPAPSLGDARFENYIDMILNLKRDAGGTVHAMPDPVMLHVRDADPAGSNTALVNLFDYSGELVDSSVDVDRLKKQAVTMDGFMLFLDPTQLYGDGSNVTLDRQIAKLNEFMADMREARNVPVGQIIPVPVAVCIPKFDLLLTENPIQGQSIPFIRKLLTQLNPPPKQTTIATIKARSDLVEQMLELMFRGVDIRALVESYFGSQVMFFPMTSVSLFENELGVSDLSKRTIAPYGVAEPFLWLLYMHGYEVFA
jgi:DNA-directed RNA polymerase subunit RPC12/RpoP